MFLSNMGAILVCFVGFGKEHICNRQYGSERLQAHNSSHVEHAPLPASYGLTKLQ